MWHAVPTHCHSRSECDTESLVARQKSQGFLYHLNPCCHVCLSGSSGSVFYRACDLGRLPVIYKKQQSTPGGREESEECAPDGLLQGVTALVGVDVVGHGPVVVVGRGGGSVREHQDAVEPHGRAQRIGQRAQHRDVALVAAHLHAPAHTSNE